MNIDDLVRDSQISKDLIVYHYPQIVGEYDDLEVRKRAPLSLMDDHLVIPEITAIYSKNSNKPSVYAYDNDDLELLLKNTRLIEEYRKNFNYLNNKFIVPSIAGIFGGVGGLLGAIVDEIIIGASIGAIAGITIGIILGVDNYEKMSALQTEFLKESIIVPKTGKQAIELAKQTIFDATTAYAEENQVDLIKNWDAIQNQIIAAVDQQRIYS